MANFGDILSLTSNHPTLGSFVYKVLRTQDNTLDTGGDRTNDDINMKTGANEMVWQINGKGGQLNVTVVDDMQKKTAERLSQEAGALADSTWTLSHINGFVYSGEGRPVGDIIPNVNTGALTLKINAPLWAQV